MRPISTEGSPDFNLVPRRTCVGGFVDCALRTAVNQGEDMPPALVGRRIKDVRIRRIHRHVVHARVLADGQHSLPGLASVG